MIDMPKAPDKFKKKEAKFKGRTALSVAKAIQEKTKGLMETEEIQPGQDITNVDISKLKFPDELDLKESEPVKELKDPDELGIEKLKEKTLPEMPAMPSKFKKYDKKLFIDKSLNEGEIKAETSEAIGTGASSDEIIKPGVEESSIEEITVPSEGVQTVEDVPEMTETTKEVPEKVSMEKGINFEIDLRPKFIKLPEIKEKTKINIKYPLISPFAFAHIFWDVKTKELIYYVEEPVLNQQEDELHNLVRVALEEMINIGFYNATNTKFVTKYLQMNVQAILIELNVKVTDKTYQKLMYYIYRDFTGMNEIEPLLKDYYIEDIECNGYGYPLYIVHRKYGNLRTNLIYKDPEVLADFVEKLAQKTGRYVSFAQPLLDGALPDGSRVNATYTKDITTRGPTFTIRKFTKEPWTPLHLIGFKTATAEVFAYLWLAIENKFNVMVIGETGSGKTTFLNSMLHFIPSEARVCSVEDTRELNLMHDNWLPAVQRLGFGIPNIMGEKYGEVSMFDLLKESFRQNPDYMVVGEVRGKEAYVLFQGMASGHPSFGTFHAGNIGTMIRRLQTPPINLSASLVETMDVVCMVTHVKTSDINMRRLRELTEIGTVTEKMGEFEGTDVFEWDASKDIINYNKKSTIFEKITKRTGMSEKQVEEEFNIRTKLLTELQKKGMAGFKDFNQIINSYYKDPKGTLKQYGL